MARHSASHASSQVDGCHGWLPAGPAWTGQTGEQNGSGALTRCRMCQACQACIAHALLELRSQAHSRADPHTEHAWESWLCSGSCAPDCRQSRAAPTLPKLPEHAPMISTARFCAECRERGCVSEHIPAVRPHWRSRIEAALQMPGPGSVRGSRSHRGTAKSGIRAHLVCLREKFRVCCHTRPMGFADTAQPGAIGQIYEVC